MTVGIVGLGLIGGSFAKAYYEKGQNVFAFDKDKSVLDFAIMSGVVAKELNKENIKKCDLIILALYPEAAVEYFEKNASYISTKSLIIDVCGTKREVCKICFETAKKHGLSYFGAHPMAGTHNSGYKYSRSNLYHNAPIVIVPDNFDDIETLDHLRSLLEPVGFGKISVTSAEEHDRLIAFTSQMPHIISNAYIKSPTSKSHKGFSAGSYKDLTRIAWLNPYLWAQLFMENKDNVLNELDFFINSLNQYKKAIENDDEETLINLLDEGRKRKQEVDGK